ncbi:MAG TPA: glutaredoxin domain-containing protein [Polyangiaceae bacterium]|nr:glutaredoxin domain-containing protein [Polyangiaceae bacterium]
MLGRLPRVSSLALLVPALLAGAWACGRDRQTAPVGSAAPISKELPPLVVRPDTPNLLLTWIDEKGEFHVVQKPADVPPAARKTVRVVVAGREAGTGQRVYVADLNETAPDGSYRLKTMSRAAWDELGASRRKARLEALAPPTPGASRAPGGGGPAPSAKPSDSAIVAIIYGADWCQPCHQAERYLRSKGVAVIKKDVEESQAAASEMRQKLERAGMRGASIPVIDVMGRLLVGFSPRALDAALSAARSATTL